MMFCLNLACDQGQNLEGSRFCQRCGHPLSTPIHQQFKIHTLLKTERHTRVYCASRPKSDRSFLIRQINLQGDHANPCPTAETFFNAEIKKLLKLPLHPHIVSLSQCLKQNQDYFLIRPYIQGPNLQQALDTANYTESMVRQILLDNLQGLGFIHQHGCVHGALTPSQVFQDPATTRFLITGLGEALALEVAASYDQFNRGQTSAQSFSQAFRQPSHDLYRLSYLCAQLLPTTVVIDSQLHHVIAKMMNLTEGDRYQTASAILQDLSQSQGVPETTPVAERPKTAAPSDSAHQYQIAYQQAVQAQYPISDTVRQELLALQRRLQLTPANVSNIESQVEKAELVRLKQLLNQ